MINWLVFVVESGRIQLKYLLIKLIRSSQVLSDSKLTQPYILLKQELCDLSWFIWEDSIFNAELNTFARLLIE